MGMRAVTTVIDHTGGPRRFWAAWASPEYQIPHVANFVTCADQADTPLTIACYVRYATDHHAWQHGTTHPAHGPPGPQTSTQGDTKAVDQASFVRLANDQG